MEEVCEILINQNVTFGQSQNLSEIRRVSFVKFNMQFF